MTIVPELTPLDRRVLEAVQNRPSQPFYIAAGMEPSPRSFADETVWRAYWDRVDARRIEVLGILHGLERCGYVRRKAGGWWQATDAVSNPQVEGETRPQAEVETC